MKERTAITEVRAQQNKVSFSMDAEYGDSAMGVDLGTDLCLHTHSRRVIKTPCQDTLSIHPHNTLSIHPAQDTFKTQHNPLITSFQTLTPHKSSKRPSTPPLDSPNTPYAFTGMVGSKDGGKMRAPQRKEQKMGLTKKQKTSRLSMSSGNSNGLSSSLVFTPVIHPSVALLPFALWTRHIIDWLSHYPLPPPPLFLKFIRFFCRYA